MVVVWCVYNFFFIEKKIFVVFLLIFLRIVVRFYWLCEGEGDFVCIEKNREEEVFFV